MFSAICQSLTHRQRNAASGYDLPVGLPDAFAGVLQVIHIDIYVPDICHHERLIRSSAGATVAGSQQCRLRPDLPGAKPVLQRKVTASLH